jgi:hypothetical protein
MRMYPTERNLENVVLLVRNNLQKSSLDLAEKTLTARPHQYKKAQVDFSRSRKLVFQCLSVFVRLTFAANATIIIVQALDAVMPTLGWQ